MHACLGELAQSAQRAAMAGLRAALGVLVAQIGEAAAVGRRKPGS